MNTSSTRTTNSINNRFELNEANSKEQYQLFSQQLKQIHQELSKNNSRNTSKNLFGFCPR